VSTGHIQITIRIKGIVSLDFQLADIFVQDNGIINLWLPFSRPGTSITIAVTVVVAQKILATCLCACPCGKGLVDGLEEVSCDVFGEERLKEVEVVCCFGGRETSEQVETGIEGHSGDDDDDEGGNSKTNERLQNLFA
jgi:hypothetical protein